MLGGVVVTSKVVVVVRSRRSSWREESAEVLWVLTCEVPCCACEKALKGVDCRCVDDVLRQEAVNPGEAEDGAVELFRLSAVAEFVKLLVVSSLCKSCAVLVSVRARWEECCKVFVCQS